MKSLKKIWDKILLVLAIIGAFILAMAGLVFLFVIYPFFALIRSLFIKGGNRKNEKNTHRQ